jgi:predicted HicB family RNase H-like nuclease
VPRAIKLKMGRPKLPKGDAKGRIVPVRFNPSDLKRIEHAARASQKTVSEWIRGTLTAAMEAQ